MYEEVMSINDILNILKKHVVMIIIMTLVGTIVAASISLFLIKPRYTAGTKVFIGKIDGENQAYSQSDVQMYQKLMKTYAETIKSRDLIEESLNNIDTMLTADEVLNNIKVTAIDNTQLLKISYEGTSPCLLYTSKELEKRLYLLLVSEQDSCLQQKHNQRKC